MLKLNVNVFKNKNNLLMNKLKELRMMHSNLNLMLIHKVLQEKDWKKCMKMLPKKTLFLKKILIIQNKCLHQVNLKLWNLKKNKENNSLNSESFKIN